MAQSEQHRQSVSAAMRRKWQDPEYRLARIPSDVRAKMADDRLCSFDELKKYHRPQWDLIVSCTRKTSPERVAAIREQLQAHLERLPQIKAAVARLAAQEERKANRQKARELRQQVKKLHAQIRELEA